MDKAGKNFRPEPLQDSDFYFFKGYLIRVSKNGKDIWVYNKRSYQSNFRGEKALEKGMEEVYRLLELEEHSRKEQQEKAQREEQAREKLKPYMDYIIKELAWVYMKYY